MKPNTRAGEAVPRRWIPAAITMYALEGLRKARSLIDELETRAGL